MKLKSAFLLVWLLLAGLMACTCAQNVSQRDMNAVRFPYENALTVLQGGVMAGDIPPDLQGPDFVQKGLAKTPHLLQALAGYYATGETQWAGARQVAVLLLCDKEGGHALLEGVLCRRDPVVVENWKESPGRPCAFSLDVQAACR